MRECRMVHLATATSGFEARLLAARLGAEGMIWQLRGESSLYPMGSVDVLVEAEDLDRARELLLFAEIDDALAEPEDHEEPSPGGHATWLAVVALVVIGLFALRAFLGV